MSAAAEQPRVSIIIPAYNAGMFLGAAISSALSQDFPDIEVVVVDDGSTDDTAQIAQGFGGRITLLQQENRGLAGARNAGVRGSRGEVIVLCDADDFLLPHHVSDALAIMDTHDSGRIWVSADAARFGVKPLDSGDRLLFYGMVPPDKQADRIVEFNFVSVFSTFPRTMFEEVGGFDERLRRCEDWNFWARAILLGWRVRFVEHVNALYRISPTSLSADVTAMRETSEAMLERLAAEHGALMTADQRRRLQERASLGSPHALRESGREALREGDLRGAQQALSASARMLRGDRRLRAQAMIVRIAAAPGVGWLRSHSRRRRT